MGWGKMNGEFIFVGVEWSEIEMEMEPECMHKLSGSGTIMELREAGAKTLAA